MSGRCLRLLRSRPALGFVARPTLHLRQASSLSRQWSTPLAETIAKAIETTGPISIAAYMRQCLTNPNGGYYTTKSDGRDQFGEKGDFITSPEISQVFGELCGLWFVAEWMSQGRMASGVELIELGPGRGTLMDDMLRVRYEQLHQIVRTFANARKTIRNFKPFASSIESVYLIEASPSLREQQKALLCGDAPMEETSIGWRSRSKYADIPVTWCEDIRLVPNDSSKTPFFVAHEFFDALPIHAFQSVEPSPTEGNTIQGLSGPIELKDKPAAASKKPQWRELVVSPAPAPSTIVTSDRPTLASKSEDPDFILSLAKASTPSSLVLPETSDRYKVLREPAGSVIEVSPESRSYAAEIARRIGGESSHPAVNGAQQETPPKSAPSGAALIIDYGPASTVPTSTLRGIRSHELVSPLSLAGQVDISADVDFVALAEAAIEASEGVEAHGPVEQGYWLESMGIRERARVLTKAAGTEEKSEAIRKAVERLVERGGGGMGKLYKVLAIVPEAGGKRRPVGFGGELA